MHKAALENVVTIIFFQEIWAIYIQMSLNNYTKV